MAKVARGRQKPASVTQFPAPSEDQTPPTPFDSDPVPPPPPAQPAPPAEPQRHGPGRPPKSSPPRESNFFQQVAAVPSDDWGQRVFLYLYVLEPVCDLKREGGRSYLMRYAAPVRDEHEVMLEHGSGKYRFILARNKFAPDGGNEQARFEFEINNPAYPPKIPEEAWMNDPRNRRWKALLPPKPPAPGTAGAPIQAAPVNPLEMFDTFMNIQDRVTDRVAAQHPAPVAPAPATDPVQAGLAIAQTLMTMRAENPMVDVLRDELKSMREEIRSEREANRTLQSELRQAQAPAATANAPKSLLDQLTEMDAVKNKLKGFLGIDEDSAPVRPGKMGWLDFAKEVIPGIVQSPILNSLAARIAAGPAAPTPQFNPALPGAPVNGNGNPAQPQLNTLQFVQQYVTPALVRHYKNGYDGSQFADWLEDGTGRTKEMQAFSPQQIFTLYSKHAPEDVKAVLFEHGDDEFLKFITEFCAWRPEAEEPAAAAPPPPQSTIIDLDQNDDKEESGS